jgi:hypothetical protein
VLQMLSMVVSMISEILALFGAGRLLAKTMRRHYEILLLVFLAVGMI